LGEELLTVLGWLSIEKANKLADLHQQYVKRCDFRDALYTAVNCITDDKPATVSHYKHVDKLDDDIYSAMQDIFYYANEEDCTRRSASEYDDETLKAIMDLVSTTFQEEYGALATRRDNAKKLHFRPLIEKRKITLITTSGRLVIQDKELESLLGEMERLLGSPYDSYIKHFKFYFTQDLQDLLNKLYLSKDEFSRDSLISAFTKIQEIGPYHP
jgi:hypothetical protein